MDFKRLSLAVILIFFAVSLSFAKKNKKSGFKNSLSEAKEKGSAVEMSKDEGDEANGEEGGDEAAESTWQLLEWEDDTQRLTLRYEVIVEQRDKRGRYTEILRMQTKDNTSQIKIEPALEPGFYRYKVISFNLFNVAKADSDWEEFTIYKAYKPRVSGTSVSVNLNSNIYLDYENDGVITFEGRNLFMPSDNPDDISFSDYVLKEDKGRKILPAEILEHSDNDRKIKFRFNMEDLDVGKYQLVVRDASGLTNDPDSGNLLTVRYKKWMDLNISAGYVCPFVLFDDTIQEYFGKMMFPLSGTARLTWFPYKRRWGHLGIGVSASYSWMMAEMDGYKLKSNLGMAHLYFAYSHPFFNKRLSLEAHVGAGVTALLGYQFEFDHDIKSDPQSSLNISFMAGVAGQFFVYKHLFVEIAADFVMYFIPDDMTFGAVLPAAGVGWQF